MYPSIYQQHNIQFPVHSTNTIECAATRLLARGGAVHCFMIFNLRKFDCLLHGKTRVTKRTDFRENRKKGLYHVIFSRSIICLQLYIRIKCYYFYVINPLLYSRVDCWLPLGISRYLCGLFIKKVFGNNEYRYYISKV